MALAVAAPLAAAAQPPDIQLASGPAKRTLKLGDVAAANAIAVVFQERSNSYMRWSTDTGVTFAPKAALRGGLRANDPRVAACGDMIWASSTWKANGGQHVGVDYRNVSLSTTGRFSLGSGQHTDVACFGNVVGITWWRNGHMFLAMSDGPCANPCAPAVNYDLGPASFDSPARISADGTGFVVSWIGDPDQITESLKVQHFQVHTTAGLIVVADPVVSLMVSQQVFSPVIAGNGSRVVLAYERRGQTHMRISEDHGATFGPKVIVSRYCLDCPEAGSVPFSIDARAGRILVEVGSCTGLPCGNTTRGFLTHDDGANWNHTPSHSGGKAIGVLRSASLAEVWDVQFYAYSPFNKPQEIGFHIRN
jgi:hypothetical protein